MIDHARLQNTMEKLVCYIMCILKVDNCLESVLLIRQIYWMFSYTLVIEQGGSKIQQPTTAINYSKNLFCYVGLSFSDFLIVITFLALIIWWTTDFLLMFSEWSQLKCGNISEIKLSYGRNFIWVFMRPLFSIMCSQDSN